MGQEIEESRFTPEDFVDYAKCLRRETELLEQWFRDDLFSARDRMGGFELEAWLVDADMQPAPRKPRHQARSRRAARPRMRCARSPCSCRAAGRGQRAAERCRDLH